MTTKDRPDSTLRPIEYWEREYLKQLGRRLKEMRLERGLLQRAVATDAQLNVASLRRIELGNRRTRRSTLQRIVDALGVPRNERTTVVSELVELAGPALAAESEFAKD